MTNERLTKESDLPENISPPNVKALYDYIRRRTV